MVSRLRSAGRRHGRGRSSRASRRAAGLAGLTGRPSTWSTSTPRQTLWLETRRVPLTNQECPAPQARDPNPVLAGGGHQQPADAAVQLRRGVVAGRAAASRVGEGQSLGGSGGRPVTRGLGDGDRGQAVGDQAAERLGVGGGQGRQDRDHDQNGQPTTGGRAARRRRGDHRRPRRSGDAAAGRPGSGGRTRPPPPLPPQRAGGGAPGRPRGRWRPAARPHPRACWPCRRGRTSRHGRCRARSATA